MKASIIFNPKAGTRDLQQQIQEAGAYLMEKGWEINWCQTEYAGHATELAQQLAARGEQVAIAVGGDGTINEVMNGLVGSETALGVLPAGTGNVFAVELQIPIPRAWPLGRRTLKQAAEVLINGQIKPVDVAQATFQNGSQRYFLLWAGIGLDAAISHAYEYDKQHRPNRQILGMYAWLITGLTVLRNFRGRQMCIRLDQMIIKGPVILTTISNLQLYGRFWRLSPNAKLDDGLLDIVIMEGDSLGSSIKHVLLATLGLHTKNPATRNCRTKSIKIETQEPVPIHLDAENVGFTPIEIEIIPQAVNLLLPTKAPAYLFSHPGADYKPIR